MDICTFDFEFSDSMNCMISFLDESSRFCKAACDSVDILGDVLGLFRDWVHSSSEIFIDFSLVDLVT